MNILQKLTDLPVTHERFYEDFDKRYINTFLLINYKAKQDVLFLYQRDGTTLYFQNSDKHTKYSIADENLILQPFLPKVGYYNYREGPVYIQKNPQRQWRRSFCYPLYYATKLDGSEIIRRHYINIASYLIQDNYTSLNDLTIVDTALSKHIAVRWISPKTADLLYDTQKIAIIDRDTKQIFNINPTFLQEIKDYLKYNRITKWNI